MARDYGVASFVVKYRLGSKAIAIRACSKTPRALCGCRATRNGKSIRGASA
jgi:hypothetical protein